MFYPKYLCCVLYKNIFFNWRWWFGLFVGRYGDDWCIVNKRVWHMTSYMLICKDMNIISKLSLFSFWMCLIYFKNFSSSLFPYNFIRCIVNKRVWHMTSYMLICKDMNIISKLSLFSFWMCLIYFKNFSSSLFPYNFITRNDIYYTLSYFVNVTLLISFFFLKKKIIIKKKID